MTDDDASTAEEIERLEAEVERLTAENARLKASIPNRLVLDASRWLENVAYAVCPDCGKSHKFVVEADWDLSLPIICPQSGRTLLAGKTEAER